jgi:hypothetical protein
MNLVMFMCRLEEYKIVLRRSPPMTNFNKYSCKKCIILISKQACSTHIYHVLKKWTILLKSYSIWKLASITRCYWLPIPPHIKYFFRMTDLWSNSLLAWRDVRRPSMDGIECCNSKNASSDHFPGILHKHSMGNIIIIILLLNCCCFFAIWRLFLVKIDYFWHLFDFEHHFLLNFSVTNLAWRC